MKYRGWKIEQDGERFRAFNPLNGVMEFENGDFQEMKLLIDGVFEQAARLEYNNSIKDSMFVRLIDGSIGIVVNESERAYDDFYHQIQILSTGYVASVFLTDFRLIPNQDKPHCVISRLYKDLTSVTVLKPLDKLDEFESHAHKHTDGYAQCVGYKVYIAEYENLPEAFFWLMDEHDPDTDSYSFDFPGYSELEPGVQRED